MNSGQSSATITIQITNDADEEAAETIILRLTDPALPRLSLRAGGSARATINPNDAPVQTSVTINCGIAATATDAGSQDYAGREDQAAYIVCRTASNVATDTIITATIGGGTGFLTSTTPLQLTITDGQQHRQCGYPH